MFANGTNAWTDTTNTTYTVVRLARESSFRQSADLRSHREPLELKDSSASCLSSSITFSTRQSQRFRSKTHLLTLNAGLLPKLALLPRFTTSTERARTLESSTLVSRTFVAVHDRI